MLGLVGESGESLKFKTWIRALESEESQIDRADMANEPGDVPWYAAVPADYLDMKNNLPSRTVHGWSPDWSTLRLAERRGVAGGRCAHCCAESGNGNPSAVRAS